MNNPLISIVVPAYDIETWLPRCLDSILTQTYPNLEIIVVDDGSTDGTSGVIKRYSEKDSRIVPLFKKNGGVTSARIEGVRISRGDYIGFVDGDDIVENDMYEFLLKNAQAYSADISHCGYQMVFEDGRINYFHNTGSLIVQERTKGLTDLLEGAIVEPGLCNKLFHKTLFCSLLHTNVMDASIKINEDLLMNYYLFSEAKLSVFEDQCKYHYIVRMSSASRQKLNIHKIFDPIHVKEIILKHCDEDVRTVAQRAYVNTCTYTYCALVMSKQKELINVKREIRELLINHYGWCNELPKRTKILAELIIRSPWILHIIYPIYANLLQKKKYE